MHYSRPILMKLEFCRHVFEKYSNMKFHENPPSGIRVIPCGRMATRRFLQFCQRAKESSPAPLKATSEPVLK